jgi:hypothetical protein
MTCELCGGDIRRPKKRLFTRVEISYIICDVCHRAQRTRTTFKMAGRGKRSVERERMRASLSMVAPRYDFRILVWGPSPSSGSPAAIKRRQIRDELRKKGHLAFFSEELTGGSSAPTNVQELIQVNNIDLVIGIVASPGSHAEFVQLAPILGPRMLAWLPVEARGGFTDTGTRRIFRALGGFDESYDSADLVSSVLTLFSLDWTEEKRFVQLWVDESTKALERIAPRRKGN